MKKIINLCLQNENFTCPLSVIHDNTRLSDDDIDHILHKYNIILKLEDENYIKYIPPYGIHDKMSLHNVLMNAFPNGIKKSKIDLCYEFANSDLNELLYKKEVYVHKFGKTTEYLLYKKFEAPITNIIDVWAEQMKEYDIVDKVFVRKF
tara:strand:+ start:777 stop:1223 length:447 start_codon:yes stop_codon:yes gene_type:complete